MSGAPKSTEEPAERVDGKQIAKLALDLAPLAAFFVAYVTGGIYVATGVLMAATVVSAVISRLWLGRIPAALVVTMLVVVAFGAMTLYLNDPRFIMMKPTIVNLLFAGVLAGGLLLKKPLLQVVLGDALLLTSEGWHKLTWRWIGFFIAMAVLNEIVWRNFSEATWASFKVFGILPLTALFAVSQVRLLQLYKVDEPADRGGAA